ncbi:unnamed protein product [Sphagnum tenellum]
MDLAKAAPTVPDCQAAAAAAPPARPAAYNTTLDHAPFETMEKYHPCPQAGISRSLMTGDVKGAQVYRTIRDPLDPMCLNKPYPGVWLEGIVDKNQKPSRTLQTNRQTSPLDPNYILPSGPSIMPSGEKMYWRAEKLYNMCSNWGQPQPTANTVTYDVLRYSLEKFGFYCTDKEFERIIQYADPFKIGSVRLELDIPRPLGFDVGYWGEPANLGQGGLVLEPVARYGRSTVLWYKSYT